jgi:hypothetical protein
MENGMNSIYYFAAWTDSGFLLGCDHEHQTVTEAVACISCAGGVAEAVKLRVGQRVVLGEGFRGLGWRNVTVHNRVIGVIGM